MALNAVTAQHTKVCCAVCSAYGLWGNVVTFTWDYLDLSPVHVCPSCLARWEPRARRLRTLKCKSWDLVHGRGSRRSPDLQCGYVSLELAPYVGASLMRTLWSLEGVNLDSRVSKGLVVLWLQSRGEIKTKQRRQSAGR